MRKRHAAILAGMAFGVTASTAEAAPIAFSYLGSATLFFSIDSAAVPDVSSPSIVEFDNVAADVNGFIETIDIKFRAKGNLAGGFELSSSKGTILNLVGNQVFGSTTDQPVFGSSRYEFKELDPGTGDQIGAGELRVGTVPLPASAPMFGAALIGLAGLGYAAKRKKSAAAA